MIAFSASDVHGGAKLCVAFVMLDFETRNQSRNSRRLARIARVTAPRSFVCYLHAFNMWTVAFFASFEHGGAKLGVA